ncbi:hypothetical protein [Streptomyces sp. NEAU-H3]|uniref:hypothetical protein n=1 Tax=Streptomyces sp. NEAU-H3 TaxID=2720636 RepID=UPI001AD98437|nr:hypothetical protein [Streptomyces sp. NEAU-H3]
MDGAAGDASPVDGAAGDANAVDEVAGDASPVDEEDVDGAAGEGVPGDVVAADGKVADVEVSAPASASATRSSVAVTGITWPEEPAPCPAGVPHGSPGASAAVPV